MAELVTRYQGPPLGTVDASLIALTEGLGEADIAAFHRHDLTEVQPSHCEAFALIPTCSASNRQGG